jgi:hypothetical protein
MPNFDGFLNSLGQLFQPLMPFVSFPAITHLFSLFSDLLSTFSILVNITRSQGDQKSTF